MRAIMRIVCVGGGPAGLYFSILMKKANPAHQITVLERNRRGETFGWGVVFSDETLSYLEENDPPTHQEIQKSFAHWDAIDIFFRGEKIRSGGHGFSGISRRQLLHILEERALGLGVELRFEQEVGDIAKYRKGGAEEADLIVASDGLNSGIRKAFESHFSPSLERRASKYIWLGTTKVFDAFTFYVTPFEDGLFQVHAYRFDKEHSTFIVETDEASWKKAGLDQASESETIAFLEKMFARELEGHRLIPNRSMWLNFHTLKCAQWSFENIVLMGDAVHTAHFSIGSGTKLAMEDAIALAGQFAQTNNVSEALKGYENERRLIVEKTQAAAQDSLLFFEHTSRYKDFDPLQFSFRLLTRSKKIGYDNLRVRDAAYVERVAQQFAHDAKAPLMPGGAAPPPMFTPFSIGNLRLENRVAVSPMCMYSAENGVPNDFHLVHLGSRAMGGAGLLFTEMTDVSADGRITPGCTGMYDKAHVSAWKRITEFVHAHSRAKIAVQLGHAGRKGATKRPWEGTDQPLESGAWPLIAASPLPYLPHSQVPREMSKEDMQRVILDFVNSAKMSVDAGFDMVELHMAHGYLLASFLSPLTNVRKDGYGGSLEARLRFPLEVFDAVRHALPKTMPMSVRVSAVDWLPDGNTGEDAVGIARALKSHGCDVVDVSTGQTAPGARPPFFGRMYQTPFADQIRNDVGIATMAVGNITTADQVNTILAAGRADLCLLARTHLRNPSFTHLAADEAGFSDLFVPPQYGLARPLPKTP